MTDADRRKDIAAEARRGEESLESASILLREKKLADGVSRAYYAAFHFARALLLSVGAEVRTHGGLERLLHRIHRLRDRGGGGGVRIHPQREPRRVGLHRLARREVGEERRVGDLNATPALGYRYDATTARLPRRSQCRSAIR